MKHNRRKKNTKLIVAISSAIIITIVAAGTYFFGFSYKKLGNLLNIKTDSSTTTSIAKVEGILDIDYNDVSNEEGKNDLFKFINDLDVKALKEGTEELLFGAEYYSVLLEESESKSSKIDFFEDNYIVVTEDTATVYKSSGRVNIMDRLNKIFENNN